MKVVEACQFTGKEDEDMAEHHEQIAKDITVALLSKISLSDTGVKAAKEAVDVYKIILKAIEEGFGEIEPSGPVSTI